MRNNLRPRASKQEQVGNMAERLSRSSLELELREHVRKRWHMPASREHIESACSAWGSDVFWPATHGQSCRRSECISIKLSASPHDRRGSESCPDR